MQHDQLYSKLLIVGAAAHNAYQHMRTKPLLCSVFGGALHVVPA